MTKALFAPIIILLAITSTNHMKTADDDSFQCDTLTVKSGCLCPGSSIVYQCAVNGSVEGLTVWQMSGCSGEISLNHDNSFVNSSGMGCPNVQATGVSIYNNECYVSELTINNISARNIGENVTCSVDVGLAVMIIGSRTLSIPTSVSLSLNPLRQIDGPQGELSFAWEPLTITECPSLRYNIVATEGCGVCPTSRSASENFITCTNVQRGRSCTFSVFVNLCSDLIRSDAITISTGFLPVITNFNPSVDDSSTTVTLTWDVVNASYCSSIEYVVNTTEGCGSCSSSEANTATCRDVRRGVTCTFFILANVCGDEVKADTNVTLKPGSSRGTSPGTIGITLGVIIAAVVVVIIIVAVLAAVWIYRRRHRCEHEFLSECGNGEEELKGMFGRYGSKVSVVIVGSKLKQPVHVIGEATTVAVLLKENIDTSDEYVPEVSGELVSGSERFPCKVKEIEHKKRYELKFTPTMRGKHQLHIKVDNKHVERSPYKITVRPSVDQLGIHVRTLSENRVINEPGGLTVNKNGEILVVEGGKQCVSVFTPDGTNINTFGAPEILGQKNLNKPHGVAVLDNGTILVTDSGDNCISVFTSEGHFIKSIGEHGSGELQFKQPMGIGIHPKTKHVYITEFENNRIHVLNQSLDYVGTFGSKGSKHGEFIQPWDVSFDSYGTGFIYIADGGNHRIQVFEYRQSRNLSEPKWNFIRAIGKEGRNEGQLMWPSSVFVDRNNQNLVYITEDDNYRVSIFSHVGKFLKSFGKKGDLPGEFDLPHGVVVDESGEIYISDHKNNRIQVF